MPKITIPSSVIDAAIKAYMNTHPSVTTYGTYQQSMTAALQAAFDKMEEIGMAFEFHSQRFGGQAIAVRLDPEPPK